LEAVSLLTIVLGVIIDKHKKICTIIVK